MELRQLGERLVRVLCGSFGLGRRCGGGLLGPGLGLLVAADSTAHNRGGSSDHRRRCRCPHEWSASRNIPHSSHSCRPTWASSDLWTQPASRAAIASTAGQLVRDRPPSSRDAARV